MSALKYQLKKVLPSLAAEARKNKDPEVKQRLYLIKAVVVSQKDVKRACEARGESRETFYKWGRKLLKTKKLESLKSGSRRPKKSPNQTAKRIEKRVKKIRKAIPFYGPERVSFYLKKWYNMVCPPSTVYNILKRLGLIAQKYRQQRTKKHMKRYRRPLPGYLQMDIKYVPYLIEGKQYYQLSAIDHCTTWRLIKAYETKEQTHVMGFLRELERVCPFPIVQVQTDNDAVFTDKYTSGLGVPTGEHPVDLWCAKNDVDHRLIPIKVKELNGKVENSHKYDDEEFYSQHSFENFQQLKRATELYNREWNEFRHTKSLGWKTPEEAVQWAYVRAIAWLECMRLKHQPEAKPMLNLDRSSNIILPIPKAKKIKKRKKQSAVDRYLQWMDWDEKYGPKCLIPVSAMCQNFS